MWAWNFCVFFNICIVQGQFSKSLLLKDKLHWIFHIKACARENIISHWNASKENPRMRMICRLKHVFECGCMFERRENFVRFSSKLERDDIIWIHVNTEISLSNATQPQKLFSVFQSIFCFLFYRSSSLIIHFERFNRHQHPAKIYSCSVLSPSVVMKSVLW